MNLSGILVVAEPGKFEAVIETLEGQPGIDVYQSESATGRIIVVQEAGSIDEEITGLKRLKKLPGIVLAEMVYHYFAENQEQGSNLDPEELDKLTGMQSEEVMDYLNS